MPDQLLNRRDQLHALIIADILLDDILRLTQPVAWCWLCFNELWQLIGRVCFRQPQTGNIPNHLPTLCRAVRAKIYQRTIGLSEHLIDPINHRLTVASRELRLQHHRVILLAQQALRLIEQPRVRAAKTVNRLFHITDQKYFRLFTITLIRR